MNIQGYHWSRSIHRHVCLVYVSCKADSGHFRCKSCYKITGTLNYENDVYCQLYNSGMQTQSHLASHKSFIRQVRLPLDAFQLMQDYRFEYTLHFGKAPTVRDLSCGATQRYDNAMIVIYDVYTKLCQLCNYANAIIPGMFDVEHVLVDTHHGCILCSYIPNRPTVRPFTKLLCNCVPTAAHWVHAPTCYSRLLTE